jgi:hypothetical protein
VRDIDPRDLGAGLRVGDQLVQLGLHPFEDVGKLAAVAHLRRQAEQLVGHAILGAAFRMQQALEQADQIILVRGRGPSRVARNALQHTVVLDIHRRQHDRGLRRGICGPRAGRADQQQSREHAHDDHL